MQLGHKLLDAYRPHYISTLGELAAGLAKLTHNYESSAPDIDSVHPSMSSKTLWWKGLPGLCGVCNYHLQDQFGNLSFVQPGEKGTGTGPTFVVQNLHDAAFFLSITTQACLADNLGLRFGSLWLNLLDYAYLVIRSFYKVNQPLALNCFGNRGFEIIGLAMNVSFFYSTWFFCQPILYF